MKNKGPLTQVLCVALVLCFSGFVIQAWHWDTGDILALIADILDNSEELEMDAECEQALLDAAAGYETALNGGGVLWDNTLRSQKKWNGYWDPGEELIAIDPGSDDVGRTIFHEGLHASGRSYSHSKIRRLVGSPGNDTEGKCRGYFPWDPN